MTESHPVKLNKLGVANEIIIVKEKLHRQCLKLELTLKSKPEILSPFFLIKGKYIFVILFHSRFCYRHLLSRCK